MLAWLFTAAYQRYLKCSMEEEWGRVVRKKCGSPLTSAIKATSESIKDTIRYLVFRLRDYASANKKRSGQREAHGGSSQLQNQALAFSAEHITAPQWASKMGSESAQAFRQAELQNAEANTPEGQAAPLGGSKTKNLQRKGSAKLGRPSLNLLSLSVPDTPGEWSPTHAFPPNGFFSSRGGNAPTLISPVTCMRQAVATFLFGLEVRGPAGTLTC